MGWSSDEEKTTKKGMETSSKILLAIIACILLIIVLLIVLLMNIEQSTYTITIDGQAVTTVTKDTILSKIDNTTYINIEEFAKLVKYEYHEGEYKAYTIEEGKCYVQGQNETATFYLNENKVFKLLVNDLNEEYEEYIVENEIKEINGKLYAPIDAVKIAFNLQIDEKEKSLTVFTLNYLVTWYDAKIKEWGYTGVADLSFENQKAILYNYFIVKKENGLYKIMDNTKKEIVSDKYKSIEFSENTKEFFVTNNLDQVGIINLDGTTSIEPIYNSISVLNKEENLYIVQKDNKYGVVKSGNITIINTEYDAIGCNKTSVELNGVKKTVNPVITIKECEGIVIKKEDKYGIININKEVIVPIQVDSIYSIVESKTGGTQYYMIYNNKELNIIDMLIEQGLIKKNENNKEEQLNNEISNQNTINKTNNTISNNTVQ